MIRPLFYMIVVSVMLSCGSGRLHPVAASVEECTFEDCFALEKTIRLQSRNEVYMGGIDEVLPFQDDYIVVDAGKTGTIGIFDGTGEFLGFLGEKGQGPGKYQAPGLVFNTRNKLYVFDSITNGMLEFNDRYQFVRNIRFQGNLGFLAPQWFASFPDGSILLYSPRRDDNGDRVFLFSGSMQYLASFVRDERPFGKFCWGGMKNLCVDGNGRVWTIGFFHPELIALSETGRVVQTIDEYLVRGDMVSRECMASCDNIQQFLKNVYYRKGFVWGLYALEDFIVVHYKIPRQTERFTISQSFFDIYSHGGRLLVRGVRLNLKNRAFVNIMNDRLFFYDIWSDEINGEDLNAVLYVYRIKKTIGVTHE